MRYNDLKSIKKLYFSYQNVARALDISEDAARILCNRYVKQKLLIRIKRNFYILKEKWDNISSLQILELANILQVPSYISLTTALSYYEYTTQVQQNFVESISIRRTIEIEIEPVAFNYTKIKSDLYFGFNKNDNFFIASPEKAFIDALYLNSLGKYKLDLSSIDLDKLEKEKCEEILEKYPIKTKKFCEKLWIN